MRTLPWIAFFLALPAGATTFGPMTVFNQVGNSNYVVKGQIQGSGWVQPEPSSRQPYTYWKVRIEDQPKGAPLGETVDIREPGGEIGNAGYHVAGSATFSEGEEVFVVIRDTEEAAKEVVSLSSGKYTVDSGIDGQSVVRSGLGFVMKDAEGNPFRPEQFSALIRRIANGTATAADKEVYLNKLPAHEKDDPVGEEHERAVQRSLQEAMSKMKVAAADNPKGNAMPAPPSLPSAEPPAASEAYSKDWLPWALGAGAVALALLLAVLFYLARPRKP